MMTKIAPANDNCQCYRVWTGFVLKSMKWLLRNIPVNYVRTTRSWLEFKHFNQSAVPVPVQGWMTSKLTSVNPPGNAAVQLQSLRYSAADHSLTVQATVTIYVHRRTVHSYPLLLLILLHHHLAPRKSSLSNPFHRIYSTRLPFATNDYDDETTWSQIKLPPSVCQ